MWVRVPVSVIQISDITPVLSKDFLDIQPAIACGFTLKRIRDMIRTDSLEISLINCEINLVLTWSANYVISSTTAADQATRFATTMQNVTF